MVLKNSVFLNPLARVFCCTSTRSDIVTRQPLAVGDLKTAVCFHIQFAQFLHAVDVKLVVDARRLIATADIVIIAQRFADNLLALFFRGVFNQNTCHKNPLEKHFKTCVVCIKVNKLNKKSAKKSNRDQEKTEFLLKIQRAVYVRQNSLWLKSRLCLTKLPVAVEKKWVYW